MDPDIGRSGRHAARRAVVKGTPTETGAVPVTPAVAMTIVDAIVDSLRHI
jgi:hypothetical protein